MAASGPGELTEIEGHLTSHQYVEILDSVMLPSARAMLLPHPEPVYIAMDNAPMHNSQAVKQWFNDHPDVIRIPWPAKSPDLMPIENLWAAMTKKWNGNVPRNRDNLVAHARQVWEELRGDDLCSKLVGSMGNRLWNVVEKGGFSTKY